MYEIEFYEDKNGKSQIWSFMQELEKQANTNKDARIQHKQIVLYIELLRKNGTFQSDNITKHLEDDIWELRP